MMSFPSAYSGPSMNPMGLYGQQSYGYGYPAMGMASAPPQQMGFPAAQQMSPVGQVMTLPSGLRYRIDRPGYGPMATPGHKVKVHYTGRLVKNGKKFDSSLDRGEPFSFKLGEGDVIKGWDQGVAGMRVGERRTLIIPSALAYGKRGAGSDIGPNEDLQFQVELLGVCQGKARYA